MQTHTIAKVIYGYELNGAKKSVLKHFENKTPGFLEFLPNKAGEIPRVFGIELDHLSEMNCIDISSLNLSATPKVEEDFADLVAQLPKNHQEFFKTLPLRTFIIWTTSAPDTKTIIKELSEAVYEYAYTYEKWNRTGSREDTEDKSYNEAVYENIAAKYNMTNFLYTEDGKKAYAAAQDAFWKSRDEDREDYDEDYDMYDGLKDFLATLK